MAVSVRAGLAGCIWCQRSGSVVLGAVVFVRAAGTGESWRQCGQWPSRRRGRRRLLVTSVGPHRWEGMCEYVVEEQARACTEDRRR